MMAESVMASILHLQYLENLLNLEAEALLRVSLKFIYTFTNGLVSFKILPGVTLQKMSLRSGKCSPLTSPVPQEPARPGGRGTSKSKREQNLMDLASHSLAPFKTLPGVTLQVSLRSGKSSPLTSPVPQEPARPGGRGTSKSKRTQNLMDLASHSLLKTRPGVTLQKMSLRSGSSGVLQYMCFKLNFNVHM